MNIELPKGYLSYSQMRLWLSNREAYRDVYYRNIKGESSKYLRFGAWFADALESKSIDFPQLPQYEVQEFCADFDVDGVRFKGWVDQYSPVLHKFREIKTGMRKIDGSARWTQADVDDHLQLDVYSLLIWLKTGKVDDECHLDWVVTRPKRKTVDVMGRKVEADDPTEMELTGEVVTIRRVVTADDRRHVRALIRSVAAEISEDYRRYLNLSVPMSPNSSKAVSSDLSGT